MKSEKDLRKYAGSVIKKLREHRNMTQDELAEELDTTRQAVSRYENGDRVIKWREKFIDWNFKYF